MIVRGGPGNRGEHNEIGLWIGYLTMEQWEGLYNNTNTHESNLKSLEQISDHTDHNPSGTKSIQHLDGQKSEPCNRWINARSGWFSLSIHLRLLFELLFWFSRTCWSSLFPFIVNFRVWEIDFILKKNTFPFPSRKAFAILISATYWWTHSHKSSVFQRQYISDYISEPLAFLVNDSFASGNFPEKLKLTRITPVFKKGSRFDIDN